MQTQISCEVRRVAQTNAILGISVGSRNFSKNHIYEYLRLCADRFEKTLIIIVDEIKKYNWMSLEGLCEEQARERALYEGEEMKRAVMSVIRRLDQEGVDRSQFRVVSWVEALKLVPTYEETLKLLEGEFKDNAQFRSDAVEMTDRYLRARKKPVVDRRTAVNFVLEETALFSQIGYFTDYNVDIYPGRFPLLENIINNKYPRLSESFGQTIEYNQIELLVS